MRLVRIFDNIVISLILFTLFSSPSLMATPIYFPAYVLPTYPPVLNRAVVQGSFIVEVSGSNGHITDVKIISHNTFLTSGKRLDTPPSAMERGITNALKKWEYERYDNNEPINFQVVIEFRLADKQQSSSRTSNCRYEISEIEGRPNRIVIEEDSIKSKEPYE